MKIATAAPSFSNQVRHISPDDALSSVTIFRVTSDLAQRDAVIAKSLSDLIAELKNFEVHTPLVLPRVTIQALGRLVVCNFRIPAGFTASILNVSVASSPTVGSVNLKVFHSRNTFGQNGSNAEASEIVTTSGELTTNSSYFAAGEFIVVLENSSTSRQEIASSVILTLRPQ